MRITLITTNSAQHQWLQHPARVTGTNGADQWPASFSCEELYLCVQVCLMSHHQQQQTETPALGVYTLCWQAHH